MSRKHGIFAAAILLAAACVLVGREIAYAQQSAPPEQYLVISEYDMAPGRTINDVIGETSVWVRDMRKTGDFKSVRLFIHNWGTGLRMYVVSEPNSWQAIKTGNDRFMAGHPEIFSAPFRWAGHSDNILTEVTVQ